MTGTLSAARWVALSAAIVLAACSADPVVDVRIEGECVPTSDAVQVLPTAPNFWAVGSVGVLGEYTLLVTYDWYEGMAPLERLVRFAWLDAEMQYVVPWTELGRGRNFEASRFVRDGESLIGWQPIVAGTETVQSAEKTLALFRLTPDGDVTRDGFELPVTTYRYPTCPEATCNWSPLKLSSALLFAAGMAPIARTSSGWAGVVGGIPAECATDTSNVRRTLLFGDSGARVLDWNAEPCLLFGPDMSPVDHSNMNLAALSSGDLGIVFRIGSSIGSGHLHFVRADATTLEPKTLPINVGRGGTYSTLFDSGWQPDVAATSDDGLLFSERTEDDKDRCDVLRRVGADGSSDFNTWQLPCYTNRFGLFTRESELMALSNGRFAMAWNERTGFGPALDYVTPLISSRPWEEGIHLTMLTADGLRGSEVVRVTPPEATGVNFAIWPRTEDDGPWPNEMAFTAASDGDDIAVMWRDRRGDAPGVYVRRFRCTAEATTSDGP